MEIMFTNAEIINYNRTSNDFSWTFARKFSIKLYNSFMAVTNFIIDFTQFHNSDSTKADYTTGGFFTLDTTAQRLKSVYINGTEATKLVTLVSSTTVSYRSLLYYSHHRQHERKDCLVLSSRSHLSAVVSPSQ